MVRVRVCNRVLIPPPRLKSGDIRKVGWQASHLCLQNIWHGFTAVVCLMVTPKKVKPSSEEETITAINLCFHPTTRDTPAGQESLKNRLRNNAVSPQICGPLERGFDRSFILTTAVLGN